jgi:signal transduction histidine kinase
MNATSMEAAQHCWQLARLRAIRLAVTLVGEDQCPDQPMVSGDPELLRTMIENLLRNAVSVSTRQSAVDLRVACEDGHVVVSVRDHGPGVPDAVAPKIFDRFVTADPSGSGRKGEGLGLTIARSIAKLHGGSVGFRNLGSESGGGAEFFVSLPLQSEPPTG